MRPTTESGSVPFRLLSAKTLESMGASCLEKVLYNLFGRQSGPGDLPMERRFISSSSSSSEMEDPHLIAVGRRTLFPERKVSRQICFASWSIVCGRIVKRDLG